MALIRNDLNDLTTRIIAASSRVRDRGRRPRQRVFPPSPIPTVAQPCDGQATDGRPPGPGSAAGELQAVPPMSRLGPCGAGVDQDTFRQIMGSLPTGVTVVTGIGDGGEPRGLTCSAVCSVSIDPPLLLLCVNRTSPTLPSFRSRGGFVVNFLLAERGSLSRQFASPVADKFAGVAWEPSRNTGLPLLHRDTVAFAECEIVSDIEAGDHTILVGVVVDGGAATTKAGPLLYWRRRYAAFPTEEPASPVIDRRIAGNSLAYVSHRP